MKTDIAVPSPVFESARQLAQSLDMSLSDLYTAALAAYVAAYTNENVTAQLDALYETEDSVLEPEMVAVQVASIGDETW